MEQELGSAELRQAAHAPLSIRRHASHAGIFAADVWEQRVSQLVDAVLHVRCVVDVDDEGNGRNPLVVLGVLSFEKQLDAAVEWFFVSREATLECDVVAIERAHVVQSDSVEFHVASAVVSKQGWQSLRDGHENSRLAAQRIVGGESQLNNAFLQSIV